MCESVLGLDPNLSVLDFVGNAVAIVFDLVRLFKTGMSNIRLVGQNLHARGSYPAYQTTKL